MNADYDNLNFCVPCLFGLEGLCADELKRLGYSNVRTENGRVLFTGAVKELAGANVNIRTGERVLLTVGTTGSKTFDELFEGVRAMPWECFIPKDGAFPVKGYSLGSKLHSIPDCQRITKKAIVTRLQKAHRTEILPETAAKYQVQFSIMDDAAVLYIDTTGAGLHKRGYRPAGVAAPLRETLAAAIVKLSRYRGRGQVFDPFCGSGTIPIEAALAALNRAPGINRGFAAENWEWISKNVWTDVRDEAKSREYKGEYEIQGSDIDPKCIKISKENAKRAGVSEYVRFETADAAMFSLEDTPENPFPVSFGASTEGSKNTIIMTNPPYGERVMEKSEAQELYRRFGTAVRAAQEKKQKQEGCKPKMYILSSHTEFERAFGIKAVKKRKLYNGMIKCDLYMWY